jgi:hypothetical protein
MDKLASVNITAWKSELPFFDAKESSCGTEDVSADGGCEVAQVLEYCIKRNSITCNCLETLLG